MMFTPLHSATGQENFDVLMVDGHIIVRYLTKFRLPWPREGYITHQLSCCSYATRHMFITSVSITSRRCLIVDIGICPGGFHSPVAVHHSCAEYQCCEV